MTSTTTGNTYTRSPADPGRTTHILLSDGQGRLSLRRLRPWHRVLARYGAARLDRELAAGASPETSATLAARAIQLTSMKLRRDLAASMHRILATAGHPAQVTLAPAGAVRPLRLPLRQARISQSAVPLAALAGYLTAPGPVPAQGAAIISQLLADGTGPLYREGCADNLSDVIENATRALTR